MNYIIELLYITMIYYEMFGILFDIILILLIPTFLSPCLPFLPSQVWIYFVHFRNIFVIYLLIKQVNHWNVGGTFGPV